MVNNQFDARFMSPSFSLSAIMHVSKLNPRRCKPIHAGYSFANSSSVFVLCCSTSASASRTLLARWRSIFDMCDLRRCVVRDFRGWCSLSMEVQTMEKFPGNLPSQKRKGNLPMRNLPAFEKKSCPRPTGPSIRPVPDRPTAVRREGGVVGGAPPRAPPRALHAPSEWQCFAATTRPQLRVAVLRGQA